ncbi:FAD-dependent oxidoreductase [Bacillus canaveralius]|uniref:FAD-dependent oxidoreductase n=1 Tax=Bacillus canaveralius TaxID=1403243 RepID=A0A2N5GKT4_9BACI|nr:FAD-dependent oxidoreductase [Bacillus canaveralius]PLR82134.1 FAD-dependent oxidoreductase [Bacillus canaveralius]PLR97960.1 FAD-dependent oxidoreductase [Bacillus canaveralius]RSK52328.1 FAD-binding oxidoreductase [Bacillus canaveralius]
MNLTTGLFFWPMTFPAAPAYPALEEDIECDVLIIGSGVSGASCAYFFSETNLKIVVIDKRTVVSGCSSANTGLLQFSNDKPLFSMINSFGERKGTRHYQLCRQALAELGQTIIRSLPFDPDFRQRDSLYFASSEKDVAGLEKEFATLRKFDFPVRFLNSADLKDSFGISKPAALLTTGDAEINTFKFAHGLLQYAQAKGVRIFEHTEMTGRTFKDGYMSVFTSNHREIKARYIIMATGHEALEEVSEKNAVLDSSYAIATNRLVKEDLWKDHVLIWETARPYLYMRTTVDNRIIIGGLDERAAKSDQRDTMLYHKRDLLVAELVKLFPHLKGKVYPDYYWTGFFGNTHDGLPIIARYERFPNTYFVMGYGGNGTVSSIISARILRDEIAGEGSKDLAIYLNARNER